MSEDRANRLPKWAQKEIDNSRYIIQSLQSEIAQLKAHLSGEIQTSISTSVGLSDGLYLDDGSTVYFWKNKDAYDGFNVRWAAYKNQTMIRISSTCGRVTIHPEASNTVLVSSERF